MFEFWIYLLIISKWTRICQNVCFFLNYVAAVLDGFLGHYGYFSQKPGGAMIVCYWLLWVFCLSCSLQICHLIKNFYFSWLNLFFFWLSLQTPGLVGGLITWKTVSERWRSCVLEAYHVVGIENLAQKLRHGTLRLHGGVGLAQVNRHPQRSLAVHEPGGHGEDALLHVGCRGQATELFKGDHGVLERKYTIFLTVRLNYGVTLLGS